MKKPSCIYIACAVATILSIWTVGAGARGRGGNGGTEIVEPGVQRTEVTRGSGWVGLYCTPKAVRLSKLRPCKVTIGPKLAEDSNFPDGQDIEVEPEDNLVFATRGIALLKAGTVLTNYYNPPDASDSDHWIVNRTFTLGKLKYQIKMTQDGGQSGSNRIILAYGGRHQIVDHMPNKFTTTPVWVGDLDRDGKPDLYVREEMNGLYSRSLLFLSSLARHGELVGEAAEYKCQLSIN